MRRLRARDRRFLLFAPLAAVLSACAAEETQEATEKAEERRGGAFYYVAGFFTTSGDLLEGTANVNPDGRGSIMIAESEGSLTCTGGSQVRDIPNLGTKDDIEGVAWVKCSDGSRFKAIFSQTRETGGGAFAWDSSGTLIDLYFDRNKEVAKHWAVVKRDAWIREKKELTESGE